MCILACVMPKRHQGLEEIHACDTYQELWEISECYAREDPALDQIRAYEKHQTLGEASECDAKKQLQCLECCSLNLW